MVERSLRPIPLQPLPIRSPIAQAYATKKERAESSERLRNISRFMKNSFPLSVYPEWSLEWKTKMFLSRRSGPFSFAAAHALNRLFRSRNAREEPGAR